MPSITLLGTGAGPELVAQGLVSAAGIIIKTSSSQLHIDPGPGILTAAAKHKVSLGQTDAILVSHEHIIHSNDINAAIYVMTNNGATITGKLIAPQSVIEGTEKNSPTLQTRFKRLLEKTLIVKPGKLISAGDTNIIPLKTKHDDEHGVGYRLMTPDFTLAYTGDTAFFADLHLEYKGADILILNTPCMNKDPNNLCIDDVKKILEKVRPKLAIITHFSKEMYEAGPIDIARDIQKATGIQTIAASDGLTIDPTTYSQVQQKTLGKY